MAEKSTNPVASHLLEGWLSIWEVLCCTDSCSGGNSGGHMKDDKHSGVIPSWEPHLCLLNIRSKKLLHFRSEKAAEEYISQLREEQTELASSSSSEVLLREWIGPNRNDFYKRNRYERHCVADLLLVADTNPAAAATAAAASSEGTAPTNSIASVSTPSNNGQSHFTKLGSFQKSQTLDNRSTQSQLLASMNEAGHDKTYSHSTSVVDKRRGSGSSLCSDESSSKPNHQHQQHQNQSKLANFFSRKSQQIKSNLKRTKSATKLDRKKTNGDSDGPLSIYEPESSTTFSQTSAANNDAASGIGTTTIPDLLKRSASTGRLSKKLLHRSHNRSSARKTYSDNSERMSGCMRTSHSHEALLISLPEARNSVDLSRPDIVVRPVHSSVWSVEHCFVVSTRTLPSPSSLGTDTLGVPMPHGHSRGGAMMKYYKCGSEAEMQKWIVNIKNCINSNRDHLFRTDNSLQLSIVESKNLPPKKRYYCELYLDKVLYARTSSKQMLDHVFWGEQFIFGELPNIQTITIHLFRETDKKKKRERPFKIGSINIPSSGFKNTPICEKWFDVHSSANRKGARESRVEGVGVRIKGRYLSVDILPLTYYLPLLTFIQNDYSSLVELLEPVISVKAKEGLATCLASSLHCTGHVVTFLCEIVMSEVDRLENNALALRGNSIATKAVEAYMKLVGQRYLVSTLKEVLKAVIDTGVDCEVDPSKLSAVASLTHNRSTLVTQCTLVWCKILNSCSSFPSELKRLFQMIRHSCESRSNIPVSICRQLISSCVFLRFFCPAILSPNLFSIIQEFPCDRGVRNLTLIAKTIQSLANLTPFGGKEKFMDFMNTFVSQQIENMKTYLDKISTLNEDEIHRPCDIVIDQSRELALLHSLLVENLKDVPEEGRAKFSNLTTILGNITSALENVPAQLQQTQQQLNNNNNSNNNNFTPPRHHNRDDDVIDTNNHPYRPSSSSVPPYTPTTVVHPVMPLKFSPPDCSDFPTTSAYVSMISKSLSSTPLTAFGHSGNNNYHYISNLQNNNYNKTSNDSSVFTSPDLVGISISFPESLNPSVRQTAVMLDEQQINRDWKKIIEAAVQSSEENGPISLVDFSDRANQINNNSNNNDNNHSHFNASKNFQPLHSTPNHLQLQQPLSFNNPSYRVAIYPQQEQQPKHSTRYTNHSGVSASHDSLKLSKNVNGANRMGAVLPSRVNQSKGISKNPYRSNSSDSIINCKENIDKSRKELTSPLSSSAPRINKSSETVRHPWSQHATSSSSGKYSSRTSQFSKSFDDTHEPPSATSTVINSSKPAAQSSSSSERLVGSSGTSKHLRPHNRDRHASNPGTLKISNNSGINARRQTVHCEVGPIHVSSDASSRPGFGSLPPQSSKVHQLQGASSSPRQQQGVSTATSVWSQNLSNDNNDRPVVLFTSGPDSTSFANSPTKYFCPEQQQRGSRQHRGLSRLSSHPVASSSPATTPAATPIEEQQQQVTSPRPTTIHTALQQQRHQNRHQQWNSILEYNRPSNISASLTGSRHNRSLNLKISEIPDSSRSAQRSGYYYHSSSASHVAPPSSRVVNTLGRITESRTIDPLSPTSMNHARKLEFFNVGVTSNRNNNADFDLDDFTPGFDRDCIDRRSAFGRFSTGKQREGSFSASSQLKSSTGRASPCCSFVSLTNQSKRMSKGELSQNHQPISSPSQQPSVLVYNVENNTSEPIICKSTSC